MTLAETLDLVLAKADDLRTKGVLRFEGAGVLLILAPKDPPAPATVPAETAPPADPLDDPDTFGGSVPQRRGQPMPPEESEE